MKNVNLKNALEEGLMLLVSTGLKIVAVVCDQRKNNESALNMLGAKKENPHFYIENN